MKINVKKVEPPKAFKPIQLDITLESYAEVYALAAFLGGQSVASKKEALARSRKGGASFEIVDSLTCRLYQELSDALEEAHP